VPRLINIFGQNAWRECEVKILVGKQVLRADFLESVNEFGGVEAIQSNAENRTFSFRIRKIGGKRSGENPLTLWLKNLEVFGCNSHEKFIPGEVFTLKKELLAVFLNRLFATDGWASILKSGQIQLGFSSVSERMIRQVQHLLLRFGVIAGLKKRAVKYKDERRTAWQLDITDALSIKKFINEIGIFGKEERLTEILQILENKKYQTNKDLIPVEIWQHISAVKGAESWSSLARRSQIEGYTNIHAGKRAPSRERLQKFAAALDDKFLQNLAESEIYWDEIVLIEYVGNKQVYDFNRSRNA
jgi:replicative DNA helicase